MCLLIGPPGVGKTLLLKRLNSCSSRGSYASVGDPPVTIPTVGTNLVNVITSRKQEVTIRELGGCMAPIWHKYYKDGEGIMYMIDMSNRVQIAASCIQLLTVLSDDRLKGTPVIMLLNKIDLPNAMTRMELESIMHLPDILHNVKQNLTVLELSARDGVALQRVADWIQHHIKPTNIASA